jgi:hypothetical protein
MAASSSGPPTPFEVQQVRLEAAHCTRRPPDPHTRCGAFAPQWVAENGDLIEAARERLNRGQLHESIQYQLQLQQNLIHLATHADEEPALERLRFCRPPRVQPPRDEEPPQDAAS